MKKLIAFILLFTVAGCALRPAPITSLDVRGTLAGLESPASDKKSADLRQQIEERKAALRKSLHHMDIWVVSFIWAPLAIAGPMYLCQMPARNHMRSEIKELNSKEQLLTPQSAVIEVSQ